MTLDLARLPEALRDHGLRVKETDGWLTRGYDWTNFVAPLTHHTGGSGYLGPATRDFVIRGRVGPNEPNPLPGPLCNSLEGIEADGIYTVYLIAGRRARHAGPGSPVVFAEILRNVHDGRSAFERGLADDESTHGNRSLFGREIHHPGSGPWADRLVEGMGRSSAALCQLAGWDPNRHLGHKHWTRRKPDPSYTGRLPDLTRRYLGEDMPLTEADLKQIGAVVRAELNRGTTIPDSDTPHAGGSWSRMVSAEATRIRNIEDAVERIEARIAAGGAGTAPAGYKGTVELTPVSD